MEYNYKKKGLYIHSVNINKCMFNYVLASLIGICRLLVLYQSIRRSTILISLSVIAKFKTRDINIIWFRFFDNVKSYIG